MLPTRLKILGLRPKLLDKAYGLIILQLISPNSLLSLGLKGFAGAIHR